MKRISLIGLSVFVLLFSTILIANQNIRPTVQQNWVTLHLSNGEEIDGILIEFKRVNLPNNDYKRIVTIWRDDRGYLDFLARDVEALVKKGFSKPKIKSDLNKLQFNKRMTDYGVIIKRASFVKLDYIDGILASYNNNTGKYNFMRNPNPFHFKDIGAIYFNESNHAHFTNLPNKWAKAPTLTQIQPVPGPGPGPNPGYNDNPDFSMTYLATTKHAATINVTRGEVIHFELSGEVGVTGPTGRRKLRREKLATGEAHNALMGFVRSNVVSRRFVVPPVNQMFIIPTSGDVSMPESGTLYLTLNDKTGINNSGEYKVKMWRQ
ncbi:MAG: hypothetical protein JW737_09820 [Acidobacteria bacterium]|nr:hypothetical protein [Acidobacteriota bacterium]